ncbi:MAG: dephospho-CoA kinase [Lachnospiraceae bacterium]|nr:dephospho-CoA kinase [Lachnospiraceae bacterium]MDY5497755.1 dephospho-CoA kinase [Anaerobutyricum sp.]
MKVVGVTGGVGSGKSVVMNILKEEYGAEIILADLVAHDLMEPGGQNYEEIVKKFGTGILSHDGTINRQALAACVFKNKEKLEILNGITHPNVRKEIFRRIDRIKAEGKASFIAVEAALLIEHGLQKEFDAMWYVYVDEETRIHRLMAARGYTEEKCRDIMKKQLPEEVFLQECSTVIDNHLDLNETKKQVKKAVDEILSLY